MNLPQALAELDPANDDHWTGDGAPRIDALTDLVGAPVTRAEVTNAAPTLTRETAPERPSVDDLFEKEAVPTTAAADAPPPETAIEEPPAVELPKLPGLEPGASVLDLDRGVVLRSPDLTQAALSELNEKVIETQRRQKEVTDELHQQYAKIQILDRANQMHASARGKGSDDSIRRYLEAQRTVREQRAARAKRFIEGGTTVQDVQDALQTKSKLDQAMNRRRAAPGSQRPVVPQRSLSN